MSEMSDQAFEQFIENPAAATRSWLRPELDRVQHELAAVRVTMAQERVQQFLDHDPELGQEGRRHWRRINDDPAFLTWLSEIDPLFGRKRHEALRQAYDLGDGTRCAHIFKAFLTGQIPSRQRTTEQLPFENRRQPRITARELERRPGERARMWRRSQIAEFYQDVRRGLYDQREAEKLRIENEIAAAARENRIADPTIQLDTK